MSIATIVVAIAGYVVVTVAGRALDTAGYEAFMVYWSLFFALTGVLDGLMQETTRAVTARGVFPGRAQASAAASSSAAASEAALSETLADPDRTTPPTNIGGPSSAAASEAAPSEAHLASPMKTTALVAAVTGLVALATGPLWAEQISPTLEGWGVALMVVGLVSYAFQATVCGLLSAAQSWTPFAWLISIDSVIRLLLAGIAWWLGWQLLAFLIVTVLGAATWLGAVALSPGTRALLPSRADVQPRAFLRRAVQAMVASGANAVMITGFTVLLKFTTDQAVAGGALAATITAITLTRAPILVPLQRFQPALIVHFTTNRHRVLTAAIKPMAAVIGLGLVGFVAAYFLAQPIMRLFFKEALIADQWVLASLTLASASTACLMITGSAALAADRHSLYSAGWIVSTVAAVGVLSWDGTPEWRSILALGAAPLLGMILHLAVLKATAPDSPNHANLNHTAPNHTAGNHTTNPDHTAANHTAPNHTATNHTAPNHTATNHTATNHADNPDHTAATPTTAKETHDHE